MNNIKPMWLNLKTHIFGMVLIILLAILTLPASAALIDITDSSFTHFANFSNDSPAGALSNISSQTDPIAFQGYGWHNSPSHLPGTPSIAGIILDTEYVVTSLKLQVHVNPFRDFVLQGSNDTTTGLDGGWTDILASTVTNRTELDWQEWNFENSNAYSSYRITATNDYVGGWAVYRWDLLADDSINEVSEPHIGILLGVGLLGVAAYRKKKL